MPLQQLCETMGWELTYQSGIQCTIKNVPADEIGTVIRKLPIGVQLTFAYINGLFRITARKP